MLIGEQAGKQWSKMIPAGTVPPGSKQGGFSGRAVYGGRGRKVLRRSKRGRLEH